MKVIDPASILQDSSIPGSPRTILSDEEASHAGAGSSNIFIDGDNALEGEASGAEKFGPGSLYARVAFIVDANITSYLMMGSVSPGLSFSLFIFLQLLTFSCNIIILLLSELMLKYC